MMVRFTKRAQSDINEIYLSLASENLDWADRTVRRIDAQCSALEQFPHRGAVLNLGFPVTVRRLVVAPYLIVYRAVRNTVFILAVVHGARDIAAALADIDLQD